MLFLLFMSGVFWDLNSIADETRQALLFWNPVAFLLDSAIRCCSGSGRPT